MPRRIRSFVAVEVGEYARESLERGIERLRAAGADVRWVRPGNLHLTVKFLGNVEMTQTGEIAGALADACAPFSPFEGELRGLAPFPSARKMRVVAVRFTAEAELARLARAVDEALVPLGVPHESRPFRAHLTLGRVKNPKNAGPLAAMLAERADMSFGEVGVDAVGLFQSELTRSGPIHTRLATAPLGGEG